MAHFSIQFTYFDKQLGHPDWTGKMVLDFGGNRGSFLTGTGSMPPDTGVWMYGRRPSTGARHATPTHTGSSTTATTRNLIPTVSKACPPRRLPVDLFS